MLMSVVGLTETVHNIYSLVLSQELFSGSYFIASDISFQLDHNLVKVSRSVFNFWQILGEIGGLYSVLYGVFALTNSIFSYKKSENFMASQLYNYDSPHSKNHRIKLNANS